MAVWYAGQIMMILMSAGAGTCAMFNLDLCRSLDRSLSLFPPWELSRLLLLYFFLSLSLSRSFSLALGLQFALLTTRIVFSPALSLSLLPLS